MIWKTWPPCRALPMSQPASSAPYWPGTRWKKHWTAREKFNFRIRKNERTCEPSHFLYRDIKNRPAVYQTAGRRPLLPVLYGSAEQPNVLNFRPAAFPSFYKFYEIFTKPIQPGPLRAGPLPGTFNLGPNQKAPESFDFSNLSGAFKLFFDYSSSILESCFLVVTGTIFRFGGVYFPLRSLCVFDYNENCCQNDVTASGGPLCVKRLDFLDGQPLSFGNFLIGQLAA